MKSHTNIPESLRRKREGRKIADQPDQIRRIDNNWYQVKSQSLSKESWYDVVRTGDGFKCDCPDHQWRHVKCKHIFACELSQIVRLAVWNSVKIQELSNKNCIHCNSENIIKRGIRRKKGFSIQRHYCNDCKRWFVFNIGFEKMHASPQIITNALHLYFSGESLRNVHNFLKLQGIDVSHMTVYRWIKKYVGLMQQYLDKITPHLSDTWRADELYLKVRGNTKYLYALLDDTTRFWIAKQVADTKYSEDITPMFAEGKRLASKKPAELITDGAANFHIAFNKEFYNRQKPFVKHTRSITLRGQKNNNKMERLNGEIRDREKVMRGLKTMDTPIIEGYRIYHNFIRGHEFFDGKTPADIASIKVEGQNKWLTIIQNAKKSQIVTGETTCQ